MTVFSLQNSMSGTSIAVYVVKNYCRNTDNIFAKNYCKDTDIIFFLELFQFVHVVFIIMVVSRMFFKIYEQNWQVFEEERIIGRRLEEEVYGRKKSNCKCTLSAAGAAA